MTNSTDNEGTPELHDRLFAGLLAWLIPGAGHFYQGRTAKGTIFCVCILGLFIFGMILGDGRVVYAQWEPAKYRRWPFLCQVGVGLPSLPAVVTSYRNAKSFFGEKWYVVPDYMPRNPNDVDSSSELDELHNSLNRRFEMGTVYTMIAGLLNMLVIYDAVAGPAYGFTRRKRPEDDKEAAAKTREEQTPVTAPETSTAPNP